MNTDIDLWNQPLRSPVREKAKRGQPKGNAARASAAILAFTKKAG